MAVVKNIITRIGADINPLQKGLDKANGSLNKFKRNGNQSINGFQQALSAASKNTKLSMGSIASSLSMGKLGLIALGAAAVASFGLLSKSAIRAAMDVEESEQLFGISMGNMAGEARKWSNQLQQDLGLNGYEVRKNVGLFYNMTTSMGLSSKGAYDLSTSLTELAYDMESFFNLKPGEAFGKLQSGISGEVEPLKRLGIIVNESTVKQFAYRNGLAAVGSELTEQQKIMARYGVIMESTKNAQGDLARTIDSPTNQLRLLRAQLDLAKIELGQAFLPIVSIVLPILTEFAKKLNVVVQAFSRFTRTLFGTNKEQSINAATANKAAVAQSNLGNEIKNAGAAAKRGIAGFDEINQLQESLASAGGDLSGSLGMEDSGEVNVPSKEEMDEEVPNKYAEAIRSKLAPQIEKLKERFDELRESLSKAYEGLEKFFKPIVEKAFLNIATRIGGAIQQAAGLAEIFNGVTTVLVGIKNGNFEKSLEGLQKIGVGVWDAAVGTVKMITPKLGESLDGIGARVTESWERYKKENPDTYNIGGWIIERLKNSFLGKFIIGAWDATVGAMLKSWNQFKQEYGEESSNSIFNIAKWIKWLWTNSALNKFIVRVWDSTVGAMLKSWNEFKQNYGESSNNSIFNIAKWIKWLWQNSTLNKWITDVWGKFREKMSEIWSNFKTENPTLFNIAEWIKEVWSNGWKGIANAIIDDINKLIEKINGFSIRIPVVDLPKVGAIGGGTLGFNVKKIDKLAKGGLTTGPTLAMVGDNPSGREAVLPLDNSGAMDMIGSTIANAVLSAMQFAGGQNSGNQSGDVIINIDGVQLARVMLPELDKERGRIGNKAIIQTV
jgi:6-pyruvoyl-tetrahydropterin synthase